MIRARSSSSRVSKCFRSVSVKRSSPLAGRAAGPAPPFTGAPCASPVWTFVGAGRVGAFGRGSGVLGRKTGTAGFALAMASGGSTPSGRTSAGGRGAALPLAGGVFAAPGRMAFGVAGTSLRGRLAYASASAAAIFAASTARFAASSLAASAPRLRIGEGFGGGAGFGVFADDGFAAGLLAGFTTFFAAGFSAGFFGAGFPLPAGFSPIAFGAG